MNHIISAKTPAEYNSQIADLRVHTGQALTGATKPFAQRYGFYPKAIYRRLLNNRFRATPTDN
jgi:hypothetical protein